MILSYAHSRAAILCFGGWGMQVMYHLLPRLQAAQEQRAALSSNPADLSRLTSFGAVIADPLIDAQQRAQFYLRQPRPDQPLPPFYVERTLGRLERELPRAFDEQTAGVLTAAEKHATLLLQATESMLQPLEMPGRPFHLPVTGLTPTMSVPNGANGNGHAQPRVRRATRQEMFQAALAHTVPIARLLETHLLDPIRQDDLVAEDPFVQTTLYVIAPLFEPLTSALIWPLVAQFMERVGQRHVAQVTAFFATGSYATDLTRPVEDASAFAALTELETLTGLQRHPDQQVTVALAQSIQAYAPHLAETIGQPLFDYVYLLDREKSNQGLAQSSHELAVVTANALEALIVAGGNLYVQEQLGVGMHNGEGRAYSLIGAAGDYVPLAQVLHAVNRQEESRLVREWVLRNSDQGATNIAGTIDQTASAQDLAGLDLTPQSVLAQLTPHLSDMLVKRDPTTVDELSVAERFVVPNATAQQLQRVRGDQWKDAFQGHYRQLDEYLQLAVGTKFLDEAWGIGAVEPGREWFLYEVDDRLLPATVSKMQRKLLAILAASPAGLTRAQLQTERWLHEIDQQRQRLQTVVTPNARHLARVQRLLALRNWEIGYLQASSTAPELWSILVRAGAVIVAAGLIAFLYVFIIQRSWSHSQDTLGWVGFALGVLTAGLIIYRIKQGRVRALRRERIALAQAALTSQLREAVSDGLVRVYGRLTELVSTWNRMLAEAASELSTLSAPPTMPSVPPPGVPLMAIHQPHLNEQLWQRCLAYLRTQLDTQGQHSEERLTRIWGTPKWFNEMRRILSSSAPGKGQSQARTVAQFIRDTVRESVAPVNLEQTTPVRAELVRGLAQEFSIEHLLWRGALEEQEFNRRLRMLELGMLSVTPMEKAEGAPVRRYVEHVWHRAKPTANYEVTNRLAVYGMTVEFVAAPGDPASELTRTLLDDFNLTLLPTNNPFTILFVRSLHGLALGDLESIRRYQAELSYLSNAERKLVLLADFFTESVYQRELYAPPKKDPRAARFASPVGSN